MKRKFVKLFNRIFYNKKVANLKAEIGYTEVVSDENNSRAWSSLVVS